MLSNNTRFTIGIDPSVTKTGFAVLTPTTKCVLLIKTDAKQSLLNRLLKIKNEGQYWLINTLRLNPIHCINACIENGSYNSNSQQDTLGQLRGVLAVWLHENFHSPIYVPPKTLKKYATCNGSADKDIMIQAAQLKGWDISNTDDDVADAAHLAELAWDLKEIRVKDLKRKQLEAIAKLMPP